MNDPKLITFWDGEKKVLSKKTLNCDFGITIKGQRCKWMEVKGYFLDGYL
jgi:hypothetical protein